MVSRLIRTVLVRIPQASRSSCGSTANGSEPGSSARAGIHASDLPRPVVGDVSPAAFQATIRAPEKELFSKLGISSMPGAGSQAFPEAACEEEKEQ